MKNLPVNQLKLYGLDIFFNEIISLVNNKKLPNQILLSGQEGVGKSTLAFHIINYILSKKEENPYMLDAKSINNKNRSYNLIKNGSHPNFYSVDLVDDKKNIEISQIRSMIEYTNKSTFNEDKKVILINNAENLNSNSLNSLLKVTEEPNENVYFIFIYNNSKYISKTLLSRCLIFKIYLSFNESISIANQIIEDDLRNVLNSDFVNYYFTPGRYVNLINFAKKNDIDLKNYSLKDFLYHIIENKYYKKNTFVKFNIYLFIELYFLKVFSNSKQKNKFILFYTNFIKKINNVNKFNLDYETLFMEFKNKVLNG